MIFAVRDQATDQFGNPMFLVSAGQAHRSFADEVNRDDAQNQLNRHPTDFALWELGTYDTDTGLFDTHPPKQLITAKDVKIKA